MKVSKGLLVVFMIFLIGGSIAGYIYFSKSTSIPETPNLSLKKENTFIYLKIYYPISNSLQMMEIRVRENDPLEEAVSEFLKGPPSIKGSYVPPGGRLLGIYNGSDGILYIDLSGEFKGNFQGDVMAESLVLRGLYETVISTDPNIKDIKLLIEGKEIDSLGGHLSLLYPIGESQEIR